MILYDPPLNLITFAIRKFLYKTFARTATFANKEINAKMQPTRGWMLEEYA